MTAERVSAGPAGGATDAALVERAAGGDPAAFQRLVEGHGPAVLRVARAILGNDPDARDAAQEAFVAAWRQLPGLRDWTSFGAWLHRIVVNTCRTQLRSRRSVREISLDVEAIDRRAPGPMLADSIVDMDVLGRAFDRLPVDRRAILVLHYLEHRPVAGIASVLGVAPGTVKWRLSEARAALARALTAEGEARQ